MKETFWWKSARFGIGRPVTRMGHQGGEEISGGGQIYIDSTI